MISQRHIFLLSLLLVALASFGQRGYTTSEQRKRLKNEFVLMPLPLFMSGFEVGFERIAGDKKGFRFLGGYYLNEQPVEDNTPYDARNLEAFRLEVQYRNYRHPYFAKANQYLAPFLVIKSGKIEDVLRAYDPFTQREKEIVSQYTASSVIFGVLFGQKSEIMSNVYFDFNFGASVCLPVMDDGARYLHRDVINPYKRYIGPRMSIGLSLAF